MFRMAYFVSVVTWGVVPAFQYGYHLSALNQLQGPLSCRNAYPQYRLGLPSCVEMDDATFGLLTSIFTVGGLLGSMLAGMSMDRYGRKGASIHSTGLIVAGSTLMFVAPWYFVLLIGRFLVGIGAVTYEVLLGIGVCVVPIFLSEISPQKIRGTIVTLNQLAIVLGILVTNGVGIPLAGPSIWRYVLLISAAISAVQLLTCGWVSDTPAWLVERDRKPEADAVARRLWNSTRNGANGAPRLSSDEDAEESLLSSGSDELPPAPPELTMSSWKLLTSKDLRRPLLIILWTFLAQQGSGINAVMYYSNAIIGHVLPEFSAYVSLFIAFINVVMTFPPIFLVERLGRRFILLSSIIGCFASSIALALGLNINNSVLSTIGVLAFVGSFAIGLGPIPFVMISELVPSYAVGSLSSLSLSFNWITNFIIGVAFLPMRNLLSGPANQQGNVFYVFSIVLLVSGIAVARMYHS